MAITASARCHEIGLSLNPLGALCHAPSCPTRSEPRAGGRFQGEVSLKGADSGSSEDDRDNGHRAAFELGTGARLRRGQRGIGLRRFRPWLAERLRSAHAGEVRLRDFGPGGQGTGEAVPGQGHGAVAGAADAADPAARGDGPDRGSARRRSGEAVRAALRGGRRGAAGRGGRDAGAGLRPGDAGGDAARVRGVRRRPLRASGRPSRRATSTTCASPGPTSASASRARARSRPRRPSGSAASRVRKGVRASCGWIPSTRATSTDARASTRSTWSTRSPSTSSWARPRPFRSAS